MNFGATTDARHTLFVSCERERCNKWISGGKTIVEQRLKGFRAYVIEQWLFTQRFPWIAVTLSASSADEVLVRQISLADIQPQFSSLAISFFTPQTSAFSIQPTRLGGILLLDTKSSSFDPKTFQLAPLMTGDWELESISIIRRILLKRLCCGNGSFETQLDAFWKLYSTEISLQQPQQPIMKSVENVDIQIEMIILKVQYLLLVVNCLKSGSFTLGKLDFPTMNAITRSRNELSLSEAIDITENVNETGFVDPKLIVSLQEKVETLKTACKNLGLKAKILNSQSFTIDSISEITNQQSTEEWESTLKSLGMFPDESVISRLPSILKQRKPQTAMEVSPIKMPKEKSKKEERSEGETRPRSGSMGETSPLVQQLQEEKEKRLKLEEELQVIQSASSKLANDWGELHSNFVKLQQQYWVLMYEAEEKGKQLEELRQSSEMTHNRLMRDIAKANELLSASKYSVQSNTQKVNRLEKNIRDLTRENQSVIFHVVFPTLLKWILAFMSMVLVCIAYAFRITKRVIYRKQEGAPQTILRAEGFVQSAQLWMENARKGATSTTTTTDETLPRVSDSPSISRKQPEKRDKDQ